MATKKNPKTGRQIGTKTEKEGKLTTAGRLAMNRTDFALAPGQAEKASGQKGRFPIHDAAHARNAVARAAQGVKAGTLTTSEAATVKKAVARKYPAIGKKGKKK